MKVLISKRIRDLQQHPTGMDALREIITSARLNEPKTFTIPGEKPGSEQKVIAQFVPVKGDA